MALTLVVVLILVAPFLGVGISVHTFNSPAPMRATLSATLPVGKGEMVSSYYRLKHRDSAVSIYPTKGLRAGRMQFTLVLWRGVHVNVSLARHGPLMMPPFFTTMGFP